MITPTLEKNKSSINTNPGIDCLCSEGPLTRAPTEKKQDTLCPISPGNLCVINLDLQSEEKGNDFERPY